MTDEPLKPPIDAPLPRDVRALMGNPDVTVWCATCQERAVPMRDGTCGFCAQPLPDCQEPPVPDADADLEPPDDPTDLQLRADAIHALLTDRGPLTHIELREELRVTAQQVRSAVQVLRSSGKVQRTGRTRAGPNGGRPSEEIGLTADLAAAEPPASLDPPKPEAELRVEAEQTWADAFQVRYVAALIGWIERAALYPGTREPPQHVYERVERLLGLTGDPSGPDETVTP